MRNPNKVSEHELYATWVAMRNRCNNPKNRAYKYYGGRGIKVCLEWEQSFHSFALDMGLRPEGCTLDRVDNDKGYEPENCRWATPQEQSSNQRRCTPERLAAHREKVRKLFEEADLLFPD